MPEIWILDGHDGEPGVEAWALAHLGFATWAPSRTELLAQLPAKFEAYCAWRRRLGVSVPTPGEIEVVDDVHGNEFLFEPDRSSAEVEEIDLAIELLAASRKDLLEAIGAAPAQALDREPSYRRFAPWADWRTIRANLAHIANSEVHYYAANIDHQPELPPAAPDGDWREFLPALRAEAIDFMRTLRTSSDRTRIRQRHFGEVEEWSVRKALRRMVRHELQHLSSIRRILADMAISN